MAYERGIRVGGLVLLGLLVGCGGGGGGGGEEVPVITRGAYLATVDVGTGGCGSSVHEVMGADVTLYSGNRVRLDVYIPETEDCWEATWSITGIETGPGTYDMDNVDEEYLCALDWDYGYQFFDLRSGTITVAGGTWTLTCGITAEHGAELCTGTVSVVATPR